jgi:hypothetical protein
MRFRFICSIALAALLSSCGGGGGEATAPTAPGAAQRAAPLAASVDVDPSALMDWAQRNYPGLFPGVQANASLPPFTYRYYPGTGNYVGVGNGAVYVLGPVSGGQLRAVASLSDFNCTLYPERCATASVPADPSGTYTAYAANGERFTLRLDFNQRTFSFTGLTFPTYASNGGFTATASDRVFAFTGTSAANASFRYSRDLIAGSYDFGTGTVPFVAARSFATSFAEAAGTYNNLGVTRTTAGVGDSAIYSSRIDADGTLYLCNDSTVYVIGLCPAASVQQFTLTLAGETFTALPANVAAGTSTFSFRVATAGGDKVYMMAAVNTTTGTRFFRIGVPESADFPSGSAWGGTTLGEWGSATFSSTSYSSTGLSADGRGITTGGALATLGNVGPTGMRALRAGSNGFAIQNTQIAVLVGARSGAGAGYMQLGAK